METNNKYYTPDKSEYHIGFEYQSLTDPRQPEKDIAWSDEELRTEVDMMNVFKYMIEDDFMEHRCKFLDKEDISEIGFEASFDEPDEWFHKFKGDNDTQLYFDDKETNLELGIGISIYHETQMVFSGYIKNKSELKFILTLLGIHHDKKT